MSYFRKIDVRIWNDSKFNSLSQLGKLVFLQLVTHPNMTMLGAMRATPAGLADELDINLEAYREAFAEVLREGMLVADAKTPCVWIPNFLKYQCAESPNVIKSWAKQVEFVPECDVRDRALASLQTHVQGRGTAFQKAFEETFRKHFPESISNKQLPVPSLPSQGNGFCSPAVARSPMYTGRGYPDGVGPESGGDDDF